MAGRALAGARLTRGIRPLALALVRDGDRILVFRGRDPVEDETFYRPLGGGIEFGEHGADAVARELREEIGATVTRARFVALLENVFTYAGEPGHELVLLFDVALAERELYRCDAIEAAQENGEPIECVWMPLDAFRSGERLYPDGLLDLIG